MFYDDLPIWGFIGKLETVQKPTGTEKRYFLFTHGAPMHAPLNTPESLISMLASLAPRLPDHRTSCLVTCGGLCFAA